MTAPSTFTWEQCVYGLLFLFFGGVELLHGYKYIRFTMLVAGFLVWSSTAVMIMIIANINTGVYQSSGVYFAVWFLVGIVGAIVSFYLWHVGIILTGAYGIFVLVAVIFTAANVTNYIFRYTFLAICVVAGGYLTKRYERLAVILATSFGGAYCMMFGLDMFVQTGFRITFHVMLSQSTAAFHPVAGTWVMIACVPVIAAFGIWWELRHHETPVGSWWLGHGARPLPPLPGEKPARKCCGITLARSATSAKAATETTKTGVYGSGSDTTLVSSPLSGTKAARTSNWFRRWFGRRSQSTENAASDSMTVLVESDAPASPAVDDGDNSTGSKDEKQEKQNQEAAVGGSSQGSNATTTPGSKGHDLFPVTQETIGHTGVRKVVIHREEREFSLDVDEKW
ncbi:hypothetical protein EDD11_004227 [Mortierella claussenii]|nr:hypothetical protein EDD11_004227 [Mortierella claussenii]